MICPHCGALDSVNNLWETYKRKDPNDMESPILINRHVKCEPKRGGCGVDWWYEKERANPPKIVKIDGKVYEDITAYSKSQLIRSNHRVNDKIFPPKGLIVNGPADLKDIK